jgi:hypothetical protein
MEILFVNRIKSNNLNFRCFNCSALNNRVGKTADFSVFIRPISSQRKKSAYFRV